MRTSEREPAAGVPGEQYVTVAFMASGAALVVFIVFGFSLVAGLVAGWCAAGVAIWWVWTRGSSAARERLRAAITVGLVAGVVSLAAYDASRLAVVKLFDLRVKPFEALRSFGDALVPGTGRTGAVLAVGIVYHVVNGLTFSVAYVGLYGRRGIVAGIIFALVLEAAMISLYPGWLHIKAVDEFTQMSIVGHLCFGIALGATSKSLLARRDHTKVASG